MDAEIQKDYLLAGKLVAEGLELGRKIIQPGINIRETLERIEEHLQSQAEIAFPAQISINEIAAHWCPEPNDETVYKEGDLVKLDIGCHVNGRIADAAITIDLSKEQTHARLIRAAEKARDAAVELATPGRTLGEMGKKIAEIIAQEGYVAVRNLGGHGLGEYNVHTTPSIPNADTGDKTILEEGMTIAIEPFASTGIGIVHEQEYANIYRITKKPRVRSVYARKAVQSIGLYGLPFSLHRLAKALGEGPARLAIKELYAAGALQTYPPLVEQKGVYIAQAEHSVIVAKKPIVYTRIE